MLYMIIVPILYTVLQGTIYDTLARIRDAVSTLSLTGWPKSSVINPKRSATGKIHPSGWLGHIKRGCDLQVP